MFAFTLIAQSLNATLNGEPEVTHTLTIHFTKLLQEIQPPTYRVALAVELPKKVQNFLKEHEEFATRYPHSRLAGSYAQDLSVGDVKDVDFLIRVDGDPEKNDPLARDVLKALKSALDDLPGYLGYVGSTDFSIERNRRSVHVAFEHQDFHLDVVPCIAPDGFDEPIYVPDWGYRDWLPSHPLGVVKLITQLEGEHPGKLRNLVKLLKHFRNTHMVYMQPKSYWLVALVIDAVRRGSIDTTQPLAMAFNQLIDSIHSKFYRHYLQDGAVPQIKDPMLGHNVAWNWERHDFTAFMDRLDDGIGWSSRALAEKDKGEAIKLWQKLFGAKFPTNVDDYARSLAATGQPGSSYATRTGLILPGASPASGTAVPSTRYYGRKTRA